MDRKLISPAALRVRAAQPVDIPALMRLKRSLAQGEDSLHAVRANAADWLRDGFGANAGFTAFVAEIGDAIVGMATCSQRIITGWSGPIVFLQDLFVEPEYRKRGVARALTARVAAHARKLGSPIVELTVRADNPAQSFYRREGFCHLPHCLTYVLAGPALAALADGDREELALAG
ncbi:MAG: GNAT family N-acetyltransferase [Hyphomicrobiales bacterium]|nr:GNAT family N-acetyltransferase [Hyphomicrobiales bacterium]